MKKIILFLILAALFLVACVPAFASTIDSTGVVSGAKFLQNLISANLWSHIAIWGGILFVVSEGLSMISAIKAN
jgi:uncharacterized protein (DUF983 family)